MGRGGRSDPWNLAEPRKCMPVKILPIEFCTTEWQYSCFKLQAFNVVPPLGSAPGSSNAYYTGGCGLAYLPKLSGKL